MKAVPNDYQTRPMTQLCQDALEILRETEHGPVRCGYIGNKLFPDAIHRGSAPFARIAGKVMKRLEHAGYAEWQRDGTGWGGWIVTPAGQLCDYRG